MKGGQKTDWPQGVGKDAPGTRKRHLGAEGTWWEKVRSMLRLPGGRSMECRLRVILYRNETAGGGRGERVTETGCRGKSFHFAYHRKGTAKKGGGTLESGSHFSKFVLADKVGGGVTQAGR